MEYISNCFKKYATFSGRARRSEFWYFALFNMFIYLLVDFVVYILRETSISQNIPVNSMNLIIATIWMFWSLYYLIALIPNIAVSVRRLHDIGRSGWNIFLALIPFIGSIWLLVYFCIEGDKGDNEYGPDPKQVSPETTKTA